MDREQTIKAKDKPSRKKKNTNLVYLLYRYSGTTKSPFTTTVLLVPNQNLHLFAKLFFLRKTATFFPGKYALSNHIWYVCFPSFSYIFSEKK